MLTRDGQRQGVPRPLQCEARALTDWADLPLAPSARLGGGRVAPAATSPAVANQSLTFSSRRRYPRARAARGLELRASTRLGVPAPAGEAEDVGLIPSHLSGANQDLHEMGKVVELPLVGGLHHRYTRRAA